MTTSWIPSFDEGNRAIGFALLISLALHLALLVMLPSIREALQRRGEAADPLVARLVEPPPKRVAEVAPAAAPVEPAKAAARQVEPAKPAAAPKRPQLPRATSAAPPIPDTSPSSEPALPSSEPAQAEAAIPSGLAPSAVSVATQPAPPASAGVDAGTLAQYRLAIMSAARQFKRYPRVARDQNWQGRVEIRLAIAPSGEISASSVRSSTGHAVLDEHALEMIERAKAMVQIPPALRGKEFSLDIPVMFSLRDAGG